MSSAYQFDLVAKKATEGTVKYGDASEELCNAVYLRKGIVKLMKDVFEGGIMPAGITLTIQATKGAVKDPKFEELSGRNTVPLK